METLRETLRETPHTKGRSSNRLHRKAVPYLLAIVLVAIATWLTKKTEPVVQEISPLFFAAVVVSTWFGGLGPALLATALAGWASAWFFYDVPAGTGVFGWDDALRLCVFLTVALLMSSLLHLRQLAEDSLKKANDELEARVRERTRALELSMRRVVESEEHIKRDLAELKRLEREVLEISENEQQRIGQDLHDGLGQELTGLAFLSQNLGRKLAAGNRPEDAEEAQRISMLANRAIEQTRELARGLSPVELGGDGLLAALRGLAEQVQKTCGIPIELHLDPGARVEDHNAAVHLYRIAQEAITNAARHSKASRIWLGVDLGLADVDQEIVVTVEDDGTGIPLNLAGKNGLGLRLMLYRARMIGATLSIERRRDAAGSDGEMSGTVVRCSYKNAVETRANTHANDREPIEREAIASI